MKFDLYWVAIIPFSRWGGPKVQQASLNIIIADDHPLFRGALRQTLETIFDQIAIHEAGTLEAVGEKLEQFEDMDLVLLDLSMPGVRGFSGLLYLRAQYPAIPVVIVSASEDVPTIRRCMEFGASGFIPKSLPIDDIAQGIRAVLNGETWVPESIDLSAPYSDEITDLVERLNTLTPQQVRVLMMLSEGLLNKQIAYELSVSEATVKAHVSAILQKLNVDSRTQAVIAAAKIEAGQWQAIGAKS
nr:response regulator transcription factor [uncultured Cohaesibacter sp.]